MKKLELGAGPFLYPMPTVLVGANVDGKANYVTVAYCGIVQHSPAMVSICLNKARYSKKGIMENGTFSVNIPSEAMLKVTDYCGITSGKQADKSALFETFYGKLQTAPMIRECPINLECKLLQPLDFGANTEILLGEIVEAYSSEEYLTEGRPDISKIRPIMFSVHDNNYWQLGAHLGKAFSIGKEFKPDK